MFEWLSDNRAYFAAVIVILLVVMFVWSLVIGRKQAVLKAAAEEGRLRIYPVDLQRAASRRLASDGDPLHAAIDARLASLVADCPTPPAWAGPWRRTDRAGAA